MEDAKGVILVAEDNESNFDLLNVILRKEYCLVRAEMEKKRYVYIKSASRI